jgi:hypothetical protein
MFAYCRKLPVLNISSDTGVVQFKGNCENIILNCYEITSLPPYSTALVTVFTNFAANCNKLSSLLNVDITSLTTNTPTVPRLIRDFTLTWTGERTSYPININLGLSLMDIDAVTALFNSLPNITTSTSRAVVCTNVYCRTQLANGSPESLAIIAIATNKGWTVTL